LCVLCKEEGADTSIHSTRINIPERLDKINKVWEYRRAGKTFDWIAEEMEFCQKTARNLFKEGLQLQAPPGAEEERILAVQQNEEQYAQAADLYNDTTDVTERVRILSVMDKLLKSRRELLGIDAPTKFQQVPGNGGLTQRELELAKIVKDLKEKHDRDQAAGPRRTPRRSAQARQKRSD
jgi:hypothetical protein